jgi:hypothetical protein
VKSRSRRSMKKSNNGRGTRTQDRLNSERITKVDWLISLENFVGKRKNLEFDVFINFEPGKGCEETAGDLENFQII